MVVVCVGFCPNEFKVHQRRMLISLLAPSPPQILSIPSASDRKPLPVTTVVMLPSRAVSRCFSRI